MHMHLYTWNCIVNYPDIMSISLIPYIMIFSRLRIFSEFQFRSLLAFLAYLNLAKCTTGIIMHICIHVHRYQYIIIYNFTVVF